MISVNAAKDVGYSLATLTGEVERPVGTDPILDANCLFEFIPDGLYGNRNEVDKLVISATGGTFVLLFGGQESGPIPFNATPAAVRGALEAFAGIGAGNVTVSGGPGNEKGTLPYVITFGGALANTNVSEVGQNGSNLTGPAIAASLETTTQGHPEGFEGANQVGCGPENPVHQSGASKVETVAGMAPATEYHLRLVVSNAGGSDLKVAPNFTTAGPQPAPVVSIDPVTAFTDTTAHVHRPRDPERHRDRPSPANGISAARLNAESTRVSSATGKWTAKNSRSR